MNIHKGLFLLRHVFLCAEMYVCVCVSALNVGDPKTLTVFTSMFQYVLNIFNTEAHTTPEFLCSYPKNWLSLTKVNIFDKGKTPFLI